MTVGEKKPVLKKGLVIRNPGQPLIISEETEIDGPRKLVPWICEQQPETSALRIGGAER
ncbi:MAG: hypothetical protein JWN63_2826 [Candidatus Acidoferrum typicum]|nr:hypothetical protein [Candidatus Acidoferrum typicum]